MNIVLIGFDVVVDWWGNGVIYKMGIDLWEKVYVMKYSIIWLFLSYNF